MIWRKRGEKKAGRISTKYLGLIFLVDPNLVIRVLQGFHTEDTECHFVQTQVVCSAEYTY